MGGDEEFTEGADPCFGGFSVVSTSSYTEQGSPQKGIMHVVRDITDRRSAEEKYRLLFEQVQEGVYVANPLGQLIDCNDAFVHMLGYSQREELLVLNLNTEICVDPKQREAFRREIEDHNYVRNFDVTLRRKDGTLLLAAESSFATRDVAGNIERYQGFVLDMTEKRRAEDEMRRRNRELNALNAMAVVAAQSFDLDEILNLTLRQVVTLFGAESGTVYLSDTDTTTYRRRAAWGPRSRDKMRTAEVCFTEGFGDLVMRSRTEVITAEYLPHLPPKAADFLRSDVDRSWSWVLFWGKDSPVGIMGLCSQLGFEYSSNDENLLVAISRQLATTIEKVRLYEETCRAYEDLRKTQEQLLQSEKMSAVGQLIAGVAHELNNPLTAILGYAQLLETEGLNTRAQDYVSKLFKQAQRTHRVVQNLLSFARQRKPQRDEVDIRKVLDETLALRDYDLKINNIKVELEAPSEAAIWSLPIPIRSSRYFSTSSTMRSTPFLKPGAPASSRFGILSVWGTRLYAVHRRRRRNQRSQAHFRSLLHHEERGQRHRPRTQHLLRHREGTWRRHHRQQCSGRRSRHRGKTAGSGISPSRARSAETGSPPARGRHPRPRPAGRRRRSGARI